LPGELREVDFISYVREKYQSEYMLLPYKVFVKANNPDATIKFNHEIKQELIVKLQEQIINLMSESGQDTNFDKFESTDLKAFIEEKKQEFFDLRAKDAQDKLNLLNDETDWDTIRHQAFMYWFATECFYDYRYIDEHGRFHKELIPPYEGFPVDNGEPYVEDHDAFLWRRKITYTQFLDKYKNRLSKKELDYVKSLQSDNSVDRVSAIIAPLQATEDRASITFGSAWNSLSHMSLDTRFTNDLQEVYEYTIQYKVPRKVRELKYIDALTGELIEIEVATDYKLNPDNGDIEYEDKWIFETYTGIRVGNELTGVYIEPERDVVQRNYNGRVKLHFGGKRGLMRDIAINPIPKRLAPYQVIDRIILLHQERAMAKMKDAILTIPKSMLADKTAEVQQQYFYMMAEGVFIYDDSLMSADEVSKAFSITGHPAADKYLRTLIELRSANRAEAFEMANMNDSRRGTAGQYQGKGAKEQDIFRAKISSTLMIHTLHKTFEKSHQSDLDVSKIAWLAGKNGTYFDSKNNRIIDVNIDGLDHYNTTYGLFVVDSKAEEKKTDMYTELAFSAAQNAEFGIAAEAIEIDNASEGRLAILKLDKEVKARQERMAAANNEAAAALEQQKAAEAEKQRAHEIELERMKQQGNTYRTLLEINKAIMLADDDALFDKTQREAAQDNIKALELQLKQHELSIKEASANKDRALKEKEMKNNMAIAKENKN
jgi:hypothetical protein